jgi:hypothetical protein
MRSTIADHSAVPRLPARRRVFPRRRVSARRRRKLVSWLRLVARRMTQRDAGRFRCELHSNRLDVDRVRSDLLEIAAMLEHVDDPDPECVRELRRLLSDGCDSPLYNRDVHPSELSATLYFVKRALAAPDAAVRVA